MTLTVSSSIACDLIRVEAGGKLMCIGIYPGGIIATPSFGGLYVSFYSECLSDRPYILDTNYRFRDWSTSAIVGFGQFRLQTQANIASPVYTNPLQVQVERPSAVQFEWLVDGIWIPVKSLHVIQAGN